MGGLNSRVPRGKNDPRFSFPIEEGISPPGGLPCSCEPWSSKASLIVTLCEHHLLDKMGNCSLARPMGKSGWCVVWMPPWLPSKLR